MHTLLTLNFSKNISIKLPSKLASRLEEFGGGNEAHTFCFLANPSDGIAVSDGHELGEKLVFREQFVVHVYSQAFMSHHPPTPKPVHVSGFGFLPCGGAQPTGGRMFTGSRPGTYARN